MYVAPFECILAKYGRMFKENKFYLSKCLKPQVQLEVYVLHINILKNYFEAPLIFK